MKEAIRQRAVELGFDDCRFTRAAAPGSARHFIDWIGGENQGEMAWLARNAQKASLFSPPATMAPLPGRRIKSRAESLRGMPVMMITMRFWAQNSNR
jgi:hypothetical protein